jgi:Ca-activated chloride channel homolog
MRSEEADIWWSPEWFSPQVLSDYFWQNKLLLYLLPAVPFLFILRWLFQVRFRPRLSLAFPPGEFLSFKSSLLRFIPDILSGISVCLILVALARPQVVEVSKEAYTEGIDIILVMDISESMRIMDFKPDRLRSSVEVAENFLDNRPYDRIGLVVFSSSALSVSPLTYDKQALKEWLNQL